MVVKRELNISETPLIWKDLPSFANECDKDILPFEISLIES